MTQADHSRIVAQAAIAGATEALDCMPDDGRADRDLASIVFADLFPGAANVERLTEAAQFVLRAGDVPGESLYRWMQGKGWHPFPPDGFDKVSKHHRMLLDLFVAFVRAADAVLRPPKAAPVIPLVPAASADMARRIGEPTGRLDERIGQGYGTAGAAVDTQAVHVHRPAVLSAGPQAQVADRRPQPSAAAIAAMSQEDRQALALTDPAFNPPAFTGPAPAPGEEMVVEQRGLGATAVFVPTSLRRHATHALEGAAVLTRREASTTEVETVAEDAPSAGSSPAGDDAPAPAAQAAEGMDAGADAADGDAAKDAGGKKKRSRKGAEESGS